MRNQPDFHQLEHAASEGNKKLVLDCLRNGLDPSGQPKEKNAPILFAISNGHTEIVKILLDAGVNPNFDWGGNGGTLLTNAVQFDRIEIVELLIARGADVNFASGLSPLYRAEILDRGPIKRLLLLKGAHLKPGEDAILKSLR